MKYQATQKHVTLQHTLLSERHLSEKATHCVIRFLGHAGKDKIVERVNKNDNR
jgi:hypothetical protein